MYVLAAIGAGGDGRSGNSEDAAGFGGCGCKGCDYCPPSRSSGGILQVGIQAHASIGRAGSLSQIFHVLLAVC